MLAAGGGAFAIGFEVPETARATERMRSAGVAAEVIMIDMPRGDRKASHPLAFPTDGPQWSPFLLTYPTEPEQRREPMRARGRLSSSFGIDHLVVETADPREASNWLATILGVPDAVPTGADWRLAVDGADIVVTAGPAERVTAVALIRPA
ncbi:VOC family protein [Nonomuraea maheshkhaliensis]